MTPQPIRLLPPALLFRCAALTGWACLALAGASCVSRATPPTEPRVPLPVSTAPDETAEVLPRVELDTLAACDGAWQDASPPAWLVIEHQGVLHSIQVVRTWEATAPCPLGALAVTRVAVGSALQMAGDVPAVDPLDAQTLGLDVDGFVGWRLRSGNWEVAPVPVLAWRQTAAETANPTPALDTAGPRAGAACSLPQEQLAGLLRAWLTTQLATDGIARQTRSAATAQWEAWTRSARGDSLRPAWDPWLQAASPVDAVAAWDDWQAVDACAGEWSWASDFVLAAAADLREEALEILLRWSNVTTVMVSADDRALMVLLQAAMWLALDNPQDALDVLAPLGDTLAQDPAAVVLLTRAHQGRVRGEGLDWLRRHLDDPIWGGAAASALAVALEQVGADDEALAAWERAAAADPEHADAWNAVGMHRYERDEVDAARAAFVRATTLAPDHADAWNNLGLLIETVDGDLAAASSAYDEALRSAPWHPGANFHLARLRERWFGDLVAARRHYQAALRGAPDWNQPAAALDRLDARPVVHADDLLGTWSTQLRDGSWVEVGFFADGVVTRVRDLADGRQQTSRERFRVREVGGPQMHLRLEDGTTGRDVLLDFVDDDALVWIESTPGPWRRAELVRATSGRAASLDGPSAR